MSNLKIFARTIEEEAVTQVNTLVAQTAFKDCKVRIMPDCHAGSGCVIGFTADLGDKVIPNIVGVDIGCLDMDTEILTRSGWVKISSYNNEDILVYNKNTDSAYFERPVSYIIQPCSYFYKLYHQKGLNQYVSEDHKILYFHGTRKRGWKPTDYNAKDFVEMHSNLSKPSWGGFKTTFSFINSKLDFTDDEVRLFVAISSDGCIRFENDNGKYIDFHLKKDRKINRLLELLKNLNIEPRVTKYEDETFEIRFYVKTTFDKNLDIFYKASKEQLMILADEVLLWDGTRDETRQHYYFSTTNKINADVVQFALAANGIRASIFEIEYSCGWNTTYQVIRTKNQYVGMQTNSIETVKSEDGKKYCFTTKTGYFVARRGNSIFITGNCGMYCCEIDSPSIDFEKLDKTIRTYVPSGMTVRDVVLVPFPELKDMFCYDGLKNVDRFDKSVGTLGSGNHFIEVNVSSDGSKTYLVIHTGSRNVGKQVADYYQNIAIEKMCGKVKLDGVISAKISELKSAGKSSEIQSEVAKIKSQFYSIVPEIPKELSYLTGEDREKYLHDMKICQRFAVKNRETIAGVICEKMGWNIFNKFHTIHNYIEEETNMVRKGAISAKLGEKLIIPINMRDGSILGEGLGNEDWNYSAPHGAGRLMGRMNAKRTLSLDEYRNQMSDVYTTSVSFDTLDEAPLAYKSMDEILDGIKPTVKVLDVIKPVYNFKASE